MQVLVDSSVWIDYFSGRKTPRTDYLHEILGRAPIVVADLVVAEVLQGYVDEAQLQTAHDALMRFPLHEIGGRALCLQSAAHQRILRGRGAPVPAADDCLIATFCIQKNLALLHSNHGLEPFERYLGLKLPDPGTPLAG